jgi:hypothetical protein
MRPLSLFLSVVVLVLLSSIGPGPTATTRAQDGTPVVPQEVEEVVEEFGFEIAPGVTAGVLPVSEDPPSLYWVRFAPGVTYTLEEDPAITLLYGQTGSLLLRLGVPVTVTRAGAMDTPGETIPAETEFTLSEGDYTVLPPNAGGEARNEGQEPAQVAIAGLVPEQLEIVVTGTPTP